jgi:hypothetical protein
VNDTYEELTQRDTEANYVKFFRQRAPEAVKEYVGWEREYDIARLEKGELTDVFELKTNHTPKGYSKAVKQLGYAHWINKGGVNTWYVSWRKDEGGRIVKPVWMRDDWQRTDNKQQLYKRVFSPDKYSVPEPENTHY